MAKIFGVFFLPKFYEELPLSFSENLPSEHSMIKRSRATMRLFSGATILILMFLTALPARFELTTYENCSKVSRDELAGILC